MIPIKKLAALPRMPAPGEEEIRAFDTAAKRTAIYVTGGEHELKGKVFGELTYYKKAVDLRGSCLTLTPLLRVFISGSGKTAIIRDGEDHARHGEIRNIIWRISYFNSPMIHTESAVAVGQKFLGDETINDPTGFIDWRVENSRFEKERARAKNEQEIMKDYFAKLPGRKLSADDEFFIRQNVIFERFLFRFSKMVMSNPITGERVRAYYVYCAACGQVEEVDAYPYAPEYRHGEKARCPICGTEATVYDIGRSKKTLWRQGLIEFAEKLDEHTLAICDCEVGVDYSLISRENMKLPAIQVRAGTRRVIDISEQKVRRYDVYREYGQVTYSLVKSNPLESGTLNAMTRNGYFYGEPAKWRSINGVWLWRHGCEGLKLGEMKYTDLPAVLSGDRRELPAVCIGYKNIARVVMNYISAPRVYEMLAKCGGEKYLLLDPSSLLSKCDIHTDGTTPAAVFGIDAKSARIIIGMNDPHSFMRARAAIQYGADPEILQTIEVWLRRGGTQYTKLKHLHLLPRKATEYGYDMDSYYDYIEQAIQLGYDLNDKYYEFPENLEEAHVAATQAIAIAKDKALDDAIMRRLPGLAAYSYNDGELLIRPAAGVGELACEAEAQHNCVYKNYTRLYANGECIIAFVRRCERPDESYITVEIADGKVVQARIKNNKLPDAAGNSFLEKYEKKVLMKLRNKAKSKYKVRVTA